MGNSPPSGDSGNWPPSHSQHNLPMLQGSSAFSQEKAKEDEDGSGTFLKPRPRGGALAFHWSEPSHMTTPNCKGGWEMLSSCTTRKQRNQACEDLTSYVTKGLHSCKIGFEYAFRM